MRIILGSGKHTDDFRFGSTTVDFPSPTQAAPWSERYGDSSAARLRRQESGANARSATREHRDRKNEVPEHKQDTSSHMLQKDS